MPRYEFSVCLMCDEASATKVNKLRNLVPASPFRDDPPHITLLRGIGTDKEISDGELLQQIKIMLDGSEHMPLTLKVKGPASIRAIRYRTTSVFLVNVPRPIRQWRRNLIRQLSAAGFHIELRERLVYLPHVTLRLGVPVRGALKRKVKHDPNFPDLLSFDHVSIFRIYIENGKRLVRELKI